MTAAVQSQRRLSGSRLFGYVSFGVMVAGWLAFAASLVSSQQTLDDVWIAVHDLPLVAEGLAWLIGLPFLVGLAIWQAGWDEGTRVAAIALLAVAYSVMFFPRQRDR